jgi:hypothetical protein
MRGTRDAWPPPRGRTRPPSLGTPIVFGPSRARRLCASADERPLGLEPRRSNSASGASSKNDVRDRWDCRGRHASTVAAQPVGAARPAGRACRAPIRQGRVELPGRKRHQAGRDEQDPAPAAPLPLGIPSRLMGAALAGPLRETLGRGRRTPTVDDQRALTVMCRGLISSTLGMKTVSRPCSNVASTASVFRPAGSTRVRRNSPRGSSWKR